ncbi:hypothetical protein C7974DRAFT_390363 [Boeremia exigua]|uniref:uncharacterized protein n=1 Tax=Boeremia exigua TaxID=749465 RepID=UPI001E8D6DAD|nr:uncharacterized protein C7974DRAFT_390363 [Boeremia exigua]KAH6637847.1 hypothetical protein C7974DRAFT_390363 [Boeremia exigua]
MPSVNCSKTNASVSLYYFQLQLVRQAGCGWHAINQTLRTLLTNNVPQILPIIRIAVASKIDTAAESLAMIQGAKRLPLYSTVINCVSYSNALALFGEDLARDTEFMKAAVATIESTLLIAEILSLLPVWMHP